MEVSATRSDGRLQGLALVTASAVVWSAGALIVRSLEAADPWTTIFWRSISAAPMLLVLMALTDGWRTIPARFAAMGLPGLVVGASFACASIGFVVALGMTTVARTLLIMSTSPLIAALLARFVLGEAIRWTTWLTIAAVIAGIALMVSDGTAGGSLRGDAVALLVAASYAVAIVTTRRHPEIGMVPGVTTGALLAAAVSLPLATPLLVTAHDLPLLILFGAGQLGVGLALFAYGARLIPAAQAALLGMLETILGPVWVWLAFAERPTAMVLLGGALVLGAVVADTLLRLRPA